MASDGSFGTKTERARQLTQAAFDLLLARLDPDRQEAGRKYESLRRKLIRFFALWGSSSPEVCADESLDRTARRLCEGTDVKSLNGFVLGVARLVHKEVVKNEIRERNVVEGLRRAYTSDPDPEQQEQRLRCYESCLNITPLDDRNLLLKYYEGEGVVRMRQREQMGIQLDMSMNSLRVRAFRIRKRMRGCLHKCLATTAEVIN